MKYVNYFLNYIFSLVYDIYYFFFGNISKRIVGISYYKNSKLYPDFLKIGETSSVAKFLAKNIEKITFLPDGYLSFLIIARK